MIREAPVGKFEVFKVKECVWEARVVKTWDKNVPYLEE